jgi:hypothetical protein
MNSSKLSFFIAIFLLAQLATAQQQFSYKRGTLQLPNADLKTGLILMPVTKTDSLDFLYFRNDASDFPVKYYADEILSVEILEGSRRFLSVLLPGDNGMVRRIAELHFAGEFFLLSVLDRKGEIFYITSQAGKIAILENTYDPPSAENSFKITYNYEYKDVLTSFLGDDGEIRNSIANLKFRRKDMTNFLKNYHLVKELPYSQYPPPTTKGYAGATGGLSLISNVNPDYSSERFSALMASTGLFGQLDSYSGPLFLRIGVAGYKGNLFRDIQDNSASNQIVFTEENVAVTMISFNLNLGFNLFTISNFTPYISSGLGHYSYTQFENSIVRETLNTSTDLVTVATSVDDEKPAGFTGIVFDAGTYYNFKSGSRIQVGASYSHFPGKNGHLKSGAGISVSYHHKLF